MSVLSMRWRVQMLPIKVISSASNTYTKSKRLGIVGLPLGRLKMVIFTYSNILLNVSMINIANGRVWMQPSSATCTVRSTYTKPPKRLGAVTPYEKRTRKTTPNVYNTSSTTTVLSHLVGDTNMESCTRPNHHNNNTNTSRARICFKALVITYTQRERERHQHSARASFKFIFRGFPQLGKSQDKRETRIFRGTPYSRALTLIKTCAQKTESNISADKKRMHCEQRVR